MFRIRDLKHEEIQRELKNAQSAVDKILESLGVDRNVGIPELHKIILKDLKKMKYIVMFEPALSKAGLENQTVPAMTIYNTKNRAEGGIIKLNPDYPEKERFEGLIHEYIHIKDDSLPLTKAVTSHAKSKVAVRKEEYMVMLQELKKMNYKIMYDEIQKFWAITMYNTKNRAEGGIIKLNPNISTRDQLEALYSEFLRIVDKPLPVDDKSDQEKVELSAEMRTYTLLMPKGKMTQKLREKNYNIDVVLKEYDFMETSSVLQWIVLTPNIPCHFAWVMYKKDENGNVEKDLTYDECYYDGRSDPRHFDIDAVLCVPESAAVLAMTNDDRKMNKPSTIKGKDYYCYAYYETDHTKKIRNKIKSELICYDRLLVIGWEKGYYDLTQEVRELEMVKEP